MRLSYSKLNAFKQCPQRYKYEYVEGLKKVEWQKEENARSWGSGVDEGLNELYLSKDLSKAVLAFKKVYTADLDEEDLARTQESGVECLKEYYAQYKEQDKNWKVLGIQIKDTFELEGIEFVVKLDLVMENLQGGGIYFWDNKTTTSKAGFKDNTSYELNEQFTAYTWYIMQKYGQCSGGLLNKITAGHRKNKYKGEPAGLHFKFERVIFNRTSDQIEYWKKNVQVWKNKIEQAERENVYGLNEGKLCSWCSFKELCITCDDEQIKQTLYMKKGEEKSNEVIDFRG